MDITLTGFMGCGKSSVGQVLADLLPEYEYIDLDAFIEESGHGTISEIFENEGEAAFRTMETEALEAIFMISNDIGRKCIVSLGGGTLGKLESRNLVTKNSTCFYLRARIDTLVENLEGASENRPMLKTEGDLKQRIEELMAKRSSIYEKTANYIIDTDGLQYEEIAKKILDELK